MSNSKKLPSEGAISTNDEAHDDDEEQKQKTKCNESTNIVPSPSEDTTKNNKTTQDKNYLTPMSGYVQHTSPNLP